MDESLKIKVSNGLFRLGMFSERQDLTTYKLHTNEYRETENAVKKRFVRFNPLFTY
jgi:hypothetical protein